MAEQQAVTFSTTPISEKQKEQEFVEHTSTYGAFLQLLKWSIITTVVILIALYLIFVH